MASYTWKGVSGDWNLASDWTPAGGPPKSTDSATINGSATTTVTVDSADVAKSLTLSDAKATVNDTSSLTIGGAFSLSAGVFNIGPSSTPGSLSVGGAFTLNGGALNVDDGTLTLSGTLTESAGSITLASGGTISGGTIDVTGGTFNRNGGTLSGVRYEGTLNLTASGAKGVVTNGLTMAGSNGAGPGTINVTGEGTLYFDNTQTFNGATINLGNANVYASLYAADVSDAGNQVLTLGSGVTINIVGSAYIEAGTYSGDGIVNEGVIDVTATDGDLIITGNAFTNTGTINDTASGTSRLSIASTTFTNEGAINVANGQTLTVGGTTFTNNGTLDVSGGASVTIEPTTFTNLPAHTLTGGTYEVEAGSTLQVDGGATITVVNADVILSGSGSEFLDDYSGASSPVALDSLLRTIGAKGELQLLAGRNWTTAGAAITNDGQIQLGGGTLTSAASGASLTDAAASKLRGFGTVTATTFTNSGTVEASGSGKTLTLTHAVGGTGDLQIEAGATLVLAATAATTNAATFNGQGATLKLDHVGNLTGAIGGIGLDDTFHLVGVTANGASVNGSDQLVVTDNGTTVDTLQLS